MLGVPPDTAADAGPSPAVLRELHRDLVRQQRRKVLTASPLLLLAAFGIVAGVMAPRQFGSFVLISGMVVFGVGQMAWEWLRLRRAEPIALYYREQREAEQQRSDLQEHLIRSSTIRTGVTIGLTALIAIVTLTQFMSTDIRHAVAAAGLVKPAVRAGDWWRLLTATYLHGDLLHVASNLGALITFGRLIEVYERRLHVPLVYLAAAVGGSALSTLLTSTASIGASGGVLGLAGYVVTVAGRQADGTPAWIRRGAVRILASTAVMGMAAFMFIDNAAHLGGAATGAALGFLTTAHARGESGLFDALGILASGILIGGAIFTVSRLIAV
jgi:membrane associated rhomboid family serine protease